MLTRRGKDVAAIVPMDDLAILEAIEDHMDLTESEKILERVKRGSEETFSLEEVKAKYQAGKRTRKPGKAKWFSDAGSSIGTNSNSEDAGIELRPVCLSERA